MIEWLKNLFASKKEAEEIETPESRALAHMLDCVTNGELYYGYDGTSLDRFGVPRLVVNSQFGRLKVSWFDHGSYQNLRSVEIGNKAFPYSNKSAKVLLKAAVHRSKGLLQEEIAKLDEKLKDRS